MQAYSGIFHLLPLGLRVQEKLERLVDKHMRSVGASKVSLSSLSSQDLWRQTGRLDKGSEFFSFEDRKGSGFLLSPTHEEEITQLVANEVKSYRDLPLRLYQVSRKYRDEKRPRQGLLRGREFLMKDLYTFDADEVQAHSTYEEVRQAYANFFDELKVPYLVAKADSGNMGGDLSHEFHFPNEKGEDDVINCNSCDYVVNEEFVQKPETVEVELQVSHTNESSKDNVFVPQHINRLQGTTSDGRTLIEAYCLKPHEINPYAVKALIPNIDLSRGVSSTDTSANSESNTSEEISMSQRPTGAKILFDRSISPADRDLLKQNLLQTFSIPITELDASPNGLPLTTTLTGYPCPSCSSGTLKVQKAIEVGHTFHLGTRYSKALNATIAINPTNSSNSNDQTLVPMQMGCHGIGLSRLIPAIASSLSNTSSPGLIWPRVISPFEVMIIPSSRSHEDTAIGIYDSLVSTTTAPSSASQDTLPIDAVRSDRSSKDLIWKLKDADLIGVPVMVVLGRSFTKSGGKLVEVQCRRLGIKEDVDIEKVGVFVERVLARL